MKNCNFIYKIILGIFVVSGLMFLECSSDSDKILPANTLSKKEITDGWRLLFDGKTFNGWRGACLDKIPDQGWTIENGCINIVPHVKSADIVTDSMYSNFDLRFEFKAPSNANSGVKYYVLEDVYEPGKALGLEYQTHYNGLPFDETKKQNLASLYEILPAKNRTIVHPAGEWQTGWIISRGTKVEHWLNGVKVLEYERGGKAFREGVSTSKFKNYPNFGEALKGRILLQYHTDGHSFRNIKIKELCN